MLLCLGPAAGLDRLVAAKLLISVSSGRARGPLARFLQRLGLRDDLCAKVAGLRALGPPVVERADVSEFGGGRRVILLFGLVRALLDGRRVPAGVEIGVDGCRSRS